MTLNSKFTRIEREFPANLSHYYDFQPCLERRQVAVSSRLLNSRAVFLITVDRTYRNKNFFRKVYQGGFFIITRNTWAGQVCLPLEHIAFRIFIENSKNQRALNLSVSIFPQSRYACHQNIPELESLQCFIHQRWIDILLKLILEKRYAFH